MCDKYMIRDLCMLLVIGIVVTCTVTAMVIGIMYIGREIGKGVDYNTWKTEPDMNGTAQEFIEYSNDFILFTGGVNGVNGNNTFYTLKEKMLDTQQMFSEVSAYNVEYHIKLHFYGFFDSEKQLHIMHRIHPNEVTMRITKGAYTFRDILTHKTYNINIYRD